MNHFARRFLTDVLLFPGLMFLAGCHSVSLLNHPQATGTHKFIDIDDYLTKEQKHAVVVWGNHAAAVETITKLEQQSGKIVLDPAVIEELVNEQKSKFGDLTEDEVVLRAGRLARADSVIFAKVAATPADGTGGYQCSVAVRAVNVEIGEVRWSGAAWYPRPVQDLDESVRLLTAMAIARARCPIERGFAWYQDKGCMVK